MEINWNNWNKSVAFEDKGPLGEETKMFIDKLGKFLKEKNREKRSKNFLLLHLSIEIQICNAAENAASILKTFEKNRK